MSYISPLAIELSKGSEHSPDEIETVLSAFINPENPNMSIEGFMGHLSKLAIGTKELNSYDQKVLDGLLSVLSDVKDARLFNSTYIGHMLSEASIPGMLGYMLGIRTGSNTVATEVSLTESKLEPEAIKALLQIVGFDPSSSSGTVTTGGTLANMTALAVARKLMQEEMRNSISKRMRVFTSPFAHYSVRKACDLLGGPAEDIEFVRVKPTEDLVISTPDLEAKIHEAKRDGVPVMAILAIAGETETGLIDPLNQIADIAEYYKIRLIVDGAYGAPYRLSRLKDKFQGMERAFAVTLDSHKALYTPYSNGAVLFKNAEDHARLAFGVKAAYLGYTDKETEIIQKLKSNTLGLGHKRIEGSMGAGPILSTVAVLRTLGFDGLRTIYNLTLDRIKYFHSLIENSNFLQPVHSPDLNLLCFTLRPEILKRLDMLENDDKLEMYIHKLRQTLDKDTYRDGGYFFSATNLPLDEKDEAFLWVWRACIMNPRTTNDVLKEAVIGLEKLISDDLD